MCDKRRTDAPSEHNFITTNRRRVMKTAGIGVAGLTTFSSVGATEHVSISWEEPGLYISNGGSTARNDYFTAYPVLNVSGEYTISSTSDIVIEVTDSETGSSLELALEPTTEVVPTEIRLDRIFNTSDGVIYDDPFVNANDGEGNLVEIPVTLTGDREIFARSTFSQYQATLREDGATVDTTGTGQFIIGYTPKPRFQSDGESFRADFVRDGLPEDTTVRLFLAGDDVTDPVNADRKITGGYTEELDTFRFTGPALEFEPTQYGLEIRRDDTLLYGSTFARNFPEITTVDQIGDPEPLYTTLSGRVEGAFDSSVGVIRATSTIEGTLTAPVSDDGSFDIEVPYEDSFQLAYAEQQPDTDLPPVYNNSPDAYILQVVSDATEETELDTYQLPDAYRLDVTVTDANGDPVEGARTWVRSYDADTTGWYGWATATDDDGVYRFGPDSTGIEVGGSVQIVVEPNSDDDRIPDVPVTRSLDVSEPTSVTVELDPVSVSGELRNVDTDVGLLYVFNNDATGTFQAFDISSSSSTTSTNRSLTTASVDAGGASTSVPSPSAEPHTFDSTQETGTLAISDAGTYSFTAQRGQELTTGYFQYTGAENSFVSLNGLPDVYALDRFTPTEALSLSPTELPAGNKVDIRAVDQAEEPIEDVAFGLIHRRNNTDAALAGSSNADGLFTRGGSPVGVELVGDVLIRAQHPDTGEEIERDVTVTEATTFTLEFAASGGDDSTPTVATYANENGRVDTGGLRTATDDWRGGTIDTGLLRNVIEAWRSGSIVA